jgi:proline iminopeptidase
VSGLILRGVCLMRPSEIDWVYRGGCRKLFPAAWVAFVEGLSEKELRDPLHAYYARLTSALPGVRHAAAKRMFHLQASLSVGNTDMAQRWNGESWEAGAHAEASRLGSLELPLRSHSDPPKAEMLRAYGTDANPAFKGFGSLHNRGDSAQQLLTAHYSVHRGFFSKTAGLLSKVHKIRHIPAIAIHGRLDMVCPVETVYDLHKVWPELEVQVLPGAGHSMHDPRIRDGLICAGQRMQEQCLPDRGFG